MNDEHFQPRRKVIKKKLRWGRFFLLIILLALIVAPVYGIFTLVDYFCYTKIDTSKITVPSGVQFDTEKAQTRINVVLLGLDGKKSDDFEQPRRTDSMLFCSFDTEAKKVAVLSIPRDTFTELPGGSKEKINHAYAYGKEAMSRQAVADFLCTHVNYHAVLDTECFMRIVDVLGGIGIYVENDMDYEDPYQDLYIHIKKGYQKLNGEQAVKYIRFRSDELGDVGRVLRQQKFMKAFADQLFSFDGILKLPYLKPIFDNVLQTDINVLSFSKMVLSFKKYSKEGIEFEMLPGEFSTIDGISYWVVTPVQVRSTLDKLGIEYIK